MLYSLFKDSSAIPREGDYTGSQGLLYCGKCRQARECFIEHPKESGHKIKKVIRCQCDIEDEENYMRRKKREDFQAYVDKLRKQGVTDEAYTLQRFENDDYRNPEITEFCKSYVEHWEQMKEKGYGITFTGAVGGGKSFYACCIANALIDNGVKVLVARLSDLVHDRVQTNTKPTVDIQTFDMVILDDIGVEGASQTAYNILDDIYRSGIPLIVTTNLSLSQLKDSPSIDKQRIYDRILQRASTPVKVDVIVSRLDTAKQNAHSAQVILNTHCNECQRAEINQKADKGAAGAD